MRAKEGDLSSRGQGVGMGMECAKGRASWAALDLSPSPATLEPRAPAQRRPAPLSGSPPTITPIAVIRGAKTSQVLPGNGLISTYC